ncbi:MAG: sigma-70 family RNA polymerase sigma factor [Verrucomicrobia bacterium]|nr:sigma-70 family RNA polymerase sigma factor [Verrucomicrobiota bacterium]
MKVVSFKEQDNYSDEELISLLREGSDALSIIYKRHKTYCINFMKRMYNDHDEIKDIFQDAVIVFYEKLNKPGFTLLCSIQTYLNSICRNQILKRIGFSKRYEIKTSDDKSEFLENITDWFDDGKEVNNERVNVMKDVLKEMKDSSSRCYDILVRFFYQNQTMDKIATDLDYTNADNAKNQKYRCQEKLKTEVFKRLKK